MPQITITKELADDLVHIIDDRLRFIQHHIQHNRIPLGQEAKRLNEFFEVVESISCGYTESPKIDWTDQSCGVKR